MLYFVHSKKFKKKILGNIHWPRYNISPSHNRQAKQFHKIISEEQAIKM